MGVDLLLSGMENLDRTGPEIPGLRGAFVMKHGAMVFLSGLCVFLPLSSEVRAVTWDGGGDGGWTNPVSWVGDAAPVAGDAILFNNLSTANLGTWLGADFSISGLTVLNPSGAVTVGGNTLTIGASGIDLSQALQNLTLNSALVLGAAQTWAVTNGRTLSVAGAIGNGGNLLSVTGGGAVAVSGVLSGAGGLTYRGPGTMTLSGINNAFGGPVTVSAGTLVAATNSALGSGAIAVSGSGRLQLNNAAFAPAAGTVTLTSGGGLVAGFANADQTILNTINGAASPQGYLILGGATASNLDFTSHAGISLGANNNYTYGGTITPAGGVYRLGGGGVGYYFSGNTGLTVTNLTGANDVVVSGAGLVTLGAGNNYTGRTIISNGAAVRIDGNFLGTAPGALVADNIVLDGGVFRFGSATWTLDATRGIVLGAGGGEFHPWSTANITIAGPISGPGGWSRTDSGAMTFSASNTFAGPITNVVGGTVTFSAAGSLGLPSGVYQGGGTFNINAPNPSAAPALFVVTNSTVNLNASAAVGGGAFDVRTGGVLVLGADNAMGTASATVRSDARLQVGAASQLPGANKVLVLNRGVYLANYANAGAETLATVDTNSTGALILGGATTANFDMTSYPGLFLGANGNYTYGGTLTPAGSAYLLGGGANSPAVSGNTFLTFTNLTGARDVVIGQPGTITLADGNDFSGRIIITNGGWLTINSDTFAPVPATLVSNYFTLDNGKLRPRNANFTLNANRGVYLGAGGAEIHVWGGYTTTVDGPVSGPGSILMTDGGTLRLTAVNSFSGGLTLNSGTVYVNADSGLGASGSPITMNGGGVRVANTLTFNNRPITLTGNGTLNTDAGATLTVTNPIAGAGSLIKEGAGTLVLQAANTYNGNTTLNGGSVQLGAAGALQSGGGKGNLFMNAGTMLDLNGFSPTVNGVTLKGGRITNTAPAAVLLTLGANNQTGLISGAIAGNLALTKTGASNFIVNVSQFYAGPTTVAQGTLTLDGASLASPVHVAAGGTLALAGATSGLRGEYYNTGAAVDLTNYASLAALNAHLAGQTPALVANSAAGGANFDFGSAGGSFPAPYNAAGTEYFESRYVGRYLAPTNGTYTFGTASDDSSMVFVDGTVVVNNNYLQGYNGGYRQGTIDLTAGYHDIVISFYEQTGGQGLGVSNAIPGGTLGMLQNASLLSVSDVSIGTLSGAQGGRVDMGAASRLTVRQASNTVFYGTLAGGTDTKLVKSGDGTLTFGYQNAGFTGAVEVTQGMLGLRHADTVGRGTITLNGGGLQLDTAGLSEGAVFNNPIGGFDGTQPNPATNIAYNTRMANTTAGWPTNTTFVYSGQIVNPGPTNVTWTFAENVDDVVRLRIDNVDILNNGGWNTPTLGTVTLTPGAHTFEARFGQGGGGAGPVNSYWWTTTTMGFGYDVQGRGESNIAYYVTPTDPGDGSLFTHDFTVTNPVVLMQTAALDAPLASGSGTLSGGIGGAGGLVKTGPGTVGLGGVNTYAGPTIVSGGTLRAVSGGAFPSATDLSVTGGATLDINGQTAAARSLALASGARFVSGAGGGSLSLGGTGTALSMQGGVTDVTAAVRLTGATGGGVTVAGGSGPSKLTDVDLGDTARTFDVGDVNASGDDLRVTGAVTGAGGLTKAGAGTMVLAGIATYGGPTVIGSGTLRLEAPQPVAGSALWLDAADAASVVLNGASVTQWSDRSGNGRDMTQATADNQPVYATSALVGDKPVVRFDGANDFLGGDFSFLNGSAYTMFAVEARQDAGNRYYLGTLGGSANNALHIGYRDSTTYTLAQYANDINVAVPAFTGQLFRTWVDELNGTGHYIFLNGSNVGSSASTVPLTVGSTTSGRVGMGFSAQYYYGDLAEILIYSSGLSDQDRAAVEAYLNFKWFGTGMVLPAATDVQIASGGVLDLNGNNQTIASLSDDGGAGGLVTNGAAATPLVLTFNNPLFSAAVFSGRIADAGGAGAISLVKNGSGTQVFTGENDYHGAVTVNDGALQVGNGGATGSLPGAIALNGAASSLVFNRSNLYVQAGAISGPGQVVQTGSGTVVMPAGVTHSYGGGTEISSGTLRVNGRLSGSGLIHVYGGGTLGGTGSVAAAILVGETGSLAPGNSTGILTAESSVTLEAGSFFRVELGGYLAGAGYDQLLLGSGAVLTLAPGAELDVGFIGGFESTVANDTVFTIVDGENSGVFSVGGVQKNDGDLIDAGGRSLRINYTPSEEITLTVVPEPAVAGLLALGLALAGLRRRGLRNRG